MVINLSPEIDAALNESARRQGVAPDVLACRVLRESGRPTCYRPPSIPQSCGGRPVLFPSYGGRLVLDAAMSTGRPPDVDGVERSTR